MAWKNCENCQGQGRTYNWGTNVSADCYHCGTNGKIWVPDPTPPSRPKPQPPKKASTSSKPLKSQQTNAQRGVATIAFIAAFYLIFNNTEGNLIGAGIAGLIAGFLGYKWFKPVLIIALIVGLIWFFSKV